MAVSAPCLPKNFALAFSSAAASLAWANCSLACTSRSSTGAVIVSLFQIQTEPQRAPFAAIQNRIRSSSQSGFGLGNHGCEAGFIVYGQSGSASCRERVSQYVEITVVAVSFKKKNKTHETTENKNAK